MPEKHVFESTREAYDWVNVGEHPETGEPIRAGDVLIVASEGVIGFACEAWPVAVVYPGWTDIDPLQTGDPGSFHLATPADESNPDHPLVKYATSVQMCIGIAESDADITGNDHWNPTR